MSEDERDWDEMREGLARLTMRELRQVARDEHITLGYAGGRKDSCVEEIVSQRQYRALASRGGGD